MRKRRTVFLVHYRDLLVDHLVFKKALVCATDAEEATQRLETMKKGTAWVTYIERFQPRRIMDQVWMAMAQVEKVKDYGVEVEWDEADHPL